MHSGGLVVVAAQYRYRETRKVASAYGKFHSVLAIRSTRRLVCPYIGVRAQLGIHARRFNIGIGGAGFPHVIQVAGQCYPRAFTVELEPLWSMISRLRKDLLVLSSITVEYR